MMKKSFLTRGVALLFTFMFLFVPGGVAETVPGVAANRWAKGTIRSKNSVNVYANLSGQALASNLKVGDRVEEGMPLIEIAPPAIYAPYDGIIRSLQGEIGDQTAYVATQYGALAYLDRSDDIQLIQATFRGAYNDPDNRNIVIGETLKVHNGNTNDPVKTEGTVVGLTETGYVLEIKSNIYDLEEDVKLYRSDDTDYKQKDQVGQGTVMNPPFIALNGEGVIADILIENNQKVSKGDLLFVLDGANMTHSSSASPVILSPTKGYLSAIYVNPGQQVVKNQLLYTIKDETTLEAVIQVDEMDVQNLSLNSVLTVVFDAYPEESFSCMVTQISGYGIEQLDTSKYEVILSLPDVVAEKALMGMHITAYFTPTTN